MSATRPCLSVPHSSAHAIVADPELRQALAALPDALVELRCERFGADAVAQMAHAVAALSAARCVVTCRTTAELGPGEPGGVNAFVQRAVIRRAAALQVAWLDVDAQRLQDDAALRAIVAARQPGTRWLASRHYYGAPPQPKTARAQWQAAAALGADACKLAVVATPLALSWPLWREALAAAPARPLVLVLMGAAGTWARLLASAQPFAPPLCYLRLRAAGATAAGQLDWQSYAAQPRWRAPVPGAPVYGVLGHPLGHSLSPALHNAVLGAHGLPGCYVAFELDTPQDVDCLLAEMAPVLNVRGLSVTLPHKAYVLRHAARRTPAARDSGACNTLCAHPSESRWQWHADNTDVGALRAALLRLHPGPWSGARVVVWGAGGVARAALLALRRLGADGVIVARRLARAQALATEMNAQVAPRAQAAAALRRCAGVVQCTPVGMAPQTARSPLSAAHWTQLPVSAFVYDTIYRPAVTRLVKQARRRQHRAEGGLFMFVAQARAQCQRLYGARPTIAWLRAWCQQAL